LRLAYPSLSTEDIENMTLEKYDVLVKVYEKVNK